MPPRNPLATRKPRFLLIVLRASLLCALPLRVVAQPGPAAATVSHPAHADGLLRSLQNGSLAPSGDDLLLTRADHTAPIDMLFSTSRALGLSRENAQWWVLPLTEADPRISANHSLWLLPLLATSPDHSWNLEWQDGTASASVTAAGIRVLLNADHVTIHRSGARPHSDAFRNSFSLRFPGGPELENALAAFYWGTMLPSVVEKTMAANFPYSSGYVLSTLKTSAYAGSYPAVDHEFQIKGRLAIGSDLDLDIVRRMIDLQFRLMNDDPERLSRAPTSVQPDGRREYHIRRNSKDNHGNAAMFPLTGNIEVIEEAWHYFEARKETTWLRANIANLEQAAAWTQASIDQYGRVWSDVYYEDQVIKDGRETQAQAFAAHSFTLLSNMEHVLGRQRKAASFSALSRKLADALIQPLPLGYWDAANHRFVDWVDRDGKVHDHLHLLANALPVTFGYATPAQSEAVTHLIDANSAQFERFPSFLAADIAAYTNSEIGDGGPYDLSAAGRYWFWDAAFRESRNQNDLLLHQLSTVAAEAAKDNYFMGERYDMDYVYYVDGKNAHGAQQYYEYPNVFAAVLIANVLGLTVPSDADLSVAPHLTTFGSVEFGIPGYAVRYTYANHSFVLKNLSARRRRIKVDLSALGTGNLRYRLASATPHTSMPNASILTLAPQEEARWIPSR